MQVCFRPKTTLFCLHSHSLSCPLALFTPQWLSEEEGVVFFLDVDSNFFCLFLISQRNVALLSSWGCTLTRFLSFFSIHSLINGNRFFIFYYHFKCQISNMLKVSQSARFYNSSPPFCQISIIFHSLDVVNRVSETQLQVSKNSNEIT